MKLPLRSALLVTTTALLTACGTGGGDAGGSDRDAPPTAPTNVRAEPGPGYVTVTWEDGSDDETGFVIYRDDGTTGASLRTHAERRAGEVGPGTERFIDTGVALSTNTSYRVAAVNEHGESQATSAPEAVTVQPGVDLLVGTNDRRYDDGLGTVFIAYLVLPEEIMLDERLVFEGTISGPGGWNGGALYEFSVPVDHFSRQQDGYEFLSESSIDAVAGTYELTLTIGSDVFTASHTLADAEYRLGPPTNIVITERSSTRVAVAWDQSAATRAAYVSLWRGEYQEFVAGYIVTTETTAAFEDLTLEDGLYQVEVAPVNTDVSTYPVKVEPFGISYETRSFALGDAVADACAGPSELVPVPDAALAQAIRTELDLADGNITCEDMALLTVLEADGAGIASLEGMQYAVNLVDLSADGNAIDDIGPLADLDRLEWLNLNENAVTDLEPLRPLTGLRGLFLCCESNAYTDLAPLEDLVNLEMLDIGGHGFDDADVAVLENFVALERLWAWGNAMSDGTVLADLDGLTHLHVGSNEISDYAFLDSLPNLVSLTLDDNPGEDMTPVASHDQLVELGLEGLGITDIGFLEAFTELQALFLTDNEISDLAPLVANPGLGAGDEVWVDENLLDLSPGSNAMNDIQTLVDRGVTVEYEPQQEP